ncbi:hypothetical protein [Mesorhizobium sp.]|uniref:hypothetical protein n=1 Tax=Mesorhizobium sp. TaxID=1871066 RepID=UPI001203155C|nr:hypothetical protein [Mesorhizobium sp.]TJV19665.1 MAG: hypothetical protein E5Y07_00280 [Mesorhizobium sp.]
MLTYFVVQSYEKTAKGALAAATPIQVQDEQHAMRLAEKLSQTNAGVIAFSRSGDPASGEYEDARVLCSYGSLPVLEVDTAIAC